MTTDQKLEREVAALSDLSRNELSERWQSTYGCQPPKGVRRELMTRSAAWHLQAKRLGGFSAETRRLLKHAVRTAEAALPAAAGSVADAGSAKHSTSRPNGSDVRPGLAPGARLVRVWNDRTHIVDVTDAGYVFDGKTYRSLSAIAKRITGAHWSGPRFFGL